VAERSDIDHFKLENRFSILITEEIEEYFQVRMNDIGSKGFERRKKIKNHDIKEDLTCTFDAVFSQYKPKTNNMRSKTFKDMKNIWNEILFKRNLFEMLNMRRIKYRLFLEKIKMLRESRLGQVYNNIRMFMTDDQLSDYSDHSDR